MADGYPPSAAVHHGNPPPEVCYVTLRGDVERLRAEIAGPPEDHYLLLDMDEEAARQMRENYADAVTDRDKDMVLMRAAVLLREWPIATSIWRECVIAHMRRCPTGEGLMEFLEDPATKAKVDELAIAFCEDGAGTP